MMLEDLNLRNTKISAFIVLQQLASQPFGRTQRIQVRNRPNFAKKICIHVNQTWSIFVPTGHNPPRCRFEVRSHRHTLLSCRYLFVSKRRAACNYHSFLSWLPNDRWMDGRCIDSFLSASPPHASNAAIDQILAQYVLCCFGPCGCRIGPGSPIFAPDADIECAEDTFKQVSSSIQHNISSWPQNCGSAKTVF